MKLKLTLLIETENVDAVRFFTNPTHRESALEDINDNYLDYTENMTAIDCVGEQVPDEQEKL